MSTGGKKARPVDYETFRSMLGEGFHTAFRKAIDGPDAMPIHRMISSMQPADWSAVLSFVADPLWDELMAGGVVNDA